jgi:hypothetical protein
MRPQAIVTVAMCAVAVMIAMSIYERVRGIAPSAPAASSQGALADSYCFQQQGDGCWPQAYLEEKAAQGGARLPLAQNLGDAVQ